MGKYLDAINNWTVEDFNLTFTPKNDTVTEAINTARSTTNDNIGLAILVALWVGLVTHISKEENRFNISTMQSIMVVNTIIFSLALMFVYLEIMFSIQVFVWTVLLIFLSQVIGIMRTTT